jgi:hypothetical protein
LTGSGSSGICQFGSYAFCGIEHRAILRRTQKPVLPAEFERDSGFSERSPITSLAIPCARDSFDDNGNPDGRTFAYSDPTDRYREVELDFARDTGLLGTVFLYLSKMRWAECHRTWGQGAIHRCK